MLKNDLEFVKLYQKGIKTILTTICGFDEFRNKKILDKAQSIDKQFNDPENKNLKDILGKLS